MLAFIERYFELKRHNTSLKQELIAAFTTFITMVYIAFVNPKILGAAGMDTQAVFVTTVLITAIASVLMGVVAKLPIALAPGMGINAYFAYVLVGSNGLTWQTGMTLIFLSAVSLFLLSLFKIRYWMVSNIPHSLRIGISVGCGLLITLIGLHNAHIIVANPDTMVALGDPKSLSFILGSLGFLIVIALAQRNVYASVLISFVVITAIALVVDPEVSYHGLVSMPPSIAPVTGQLEFKEIASFSMVGVIVSVMLINLFESSGTFIAVTTKAGLADDKGHYPNQQKSLLIDSSASAVGSYMGTSAVTAYIESASGVAVGGRSGLMSFAVGILFLALLFFSPLEKMIPLYATTGALLYIGVLMISELSKIDWDDLTEATPSFVAAVAMPFTFTITEGIALGFITYVVLKLMAGKFKDITVCTGLMALLFLLRYIFL
ncbi:adenine permease PurP [Wohlfahrtiimonas chitiniclastica]|uniref:NCS2 family permease n=1 Tax=Wohlfahrtiimonas chitiniclastica TaxID=400946 RepID=UPI000B9852C1|nr:NCS2 family permease [Wohlfahrtiimonas chitiniclastica]OYQ87808.1 adenine permease PurP [Wohlfahrtiimonas chitiniclastica]